MHLDHDPTIRWSTLIEATRLKKGFGSKADAGELVRWCKAHQVTRVYVENFRTGYFADDQTIRSVANALREGGIEPAGGVTPNGMAGRSTGWHIIGCFTDTASVRQLQQAMEQAASLFDLVMIDDFFFTDCECDNCVAARADRSWAEFRMDLMVDLALNHVIGPARKVNPDVRLILKYPQWYDLLHQRGYDVCRMTEAFDMTWAGTELRDPDHDDPILPNILQTEGQFVMRWIEALSGHKCGGGWFDVLATSPDTYLEQAWQTILGGAREIVLFNYHSFGQPDGQACLDRLAEHRAALEELAGQVAARSPRGIATPKPPHSDPADGRHVYDHFGMLGLPMHPQVYLTADSPSAFVPAENLADPDIARSVNQMLAAGKPILATDGLLDRCPGVHHDHPMLKRLDLAGDPRSMFHLPQHELRDIRDHLLTPLGIGLDAPVGVGSVLVGDDLVAISNFRPGNSTVYLSGLADRPVEMVTELPHDRTIAVEIDAGRVELRMPPRSLAVVRAGR